MERIEGTSLYYSREKRTLYKENEDGKPIPIVRDCVYFKYPLIGIKVFKVAERVNGQVKTLVGYINKDGSNINKTTFGEDDVYPVVENKKISAMERRDENGRVIEIIPV